MPVAIGEKHLAVAVEDHPLDYGYFEGTIPEGEYGAGTVSIWDNGTYDTKHWDPDKIEITLHGHRVSGPYVWYGSNVQGKVNGWYSGQEVEGYSSQITDKEIFFYSSRIFNRSLPIIKRKK